MSLEAFLNNFNSVDGKYLYTIDPLKTFDVNIIFDSECISEGSADNSGGSIGPLGNKISNLANNITGGLFGKALNSSKSSMSSGYSDIPSIAAASLFSDGNCTSMNLRYFVQKVTLPNLKIQDGEVSETLFGNLQTHKMAVEPDSKTFTMSILNTKVSLIDRIFYPWMREISYPYWSYNKIPYSTARIEIDMREHNDICYVFLGSRPTTIHSINPTNMLDTTMERDVVFTFDFMYIKSKGENIESVKDTIMNTGKSIVNKAASMIGL